MADKHTVFVGGLDSRTKAEDLQDRKISTFTTCA
jgi:hypothetical protein